MLSRSYQNNSVSRGGKWPQKSFVDLSLKRKCSESVCLTEMKSITKSQAPSQRSVLLPLACINESRRLQRP